MSACESKLVSRSNRKATVAKTVRPRPHGHMPSVVGDCGQVVQVLDWALTTIPNIALVLRSNIQRRLCVEHSHELFSNIRGRGGASNVWLPLVNEPLP